MSSLVGEWVEKAEGDFNAAGRELRVRKNPAYHVSCFLAQQSAEKYLKAILEYQNQAIPKIHGLIELLELCKLRDASLEFLRADLQALERYSVRVRYPGVVSDKDDARLAFKAAKIVREIIRQKLDLE